MPHLRRALGAPYLDSEMWASCDARPHSAPVALPLNHHATPTHRRPPRHRRPKRLLPGGSIWPSPTVTPSSPSSTSSPKIRPRHPHPGLAPPPAHLLRLHPQQTALRNHRSPPTAPRPSGPITVVQHTEGAAFHPALDIPHAELILRKGFRRHIDSYSAFLENDHTTPTGLAGYLRERNLNASSSAASPTTSASATPPSTAKTSASKPSSSKTPPAPSISPTA